MALAKAAQDLDVRSFEQSTVEQLATGLRPIVLALASEGDALADVVSAALTSSSDDQDVDEPSRPADPAAVFLPFEQLLDRSLSDDGAISKREAADVAFAMHLELERHTLRLERASTSRNRLAVLAECDVALRRLGKALAWLDNAMARLGGAPARLAHETEAARDLRVLETWAATRAAINDGGVPTEADVVARMRRAVSIIATLVEAHAYTSLDLRERLHVRKLQARILDWLESAGDRSDGLAIWQELAGSAGLSSRGRVAGVPYQTARGAA